MSDDAKDSALQPPEARSRAWTILAAVLPYAVLLLLLFAMGIRDVLRTREDLRRIFYTADNFASIGRDCAPVIIAAVGMTLVIVSGGIDLSVGSIMGLAGAVAGGVTNLSQSAFIGVLAGVATGMGCGAVNGGLIVGLRVQPFIATLGTLMALRGACEIATGNGSIFIGDGTDGAARGQLVADFQWIAKGHVTGIPAPLLVVAAVLVIFWVILNHTRLGRRVYAVGSNEDASRLSGVRVPQVKLAVYIFGGLLAGLAGVLTAARVGGPSANAGSGKELVVISAVVIGGASLSGGQGTISGCVIGALLMSVLETVCTSYYSYGVTDSWQKIIIGMFLVLAVAVDQLRRSRMK